MDLETTVLARKLRANGNSLRTIGHQLGYSHQAVLAVVAGIDPGPVTGQDGITRRGLRGKRMPCIWCGEQQQRPHSRYCSRRCARQRWRYHRWLQTGQVPPLRPDRWLDPPNDIR